jgi:hypothetical protein
MQYEPFGPHVPPKPATSALQVPTQQGGVFGVDADGNPGLTSPGKPLMSRQLPFKMPSMRTMLAGARGQPHVLGATGPSTAAHDKATSTFSNAVMSPEMVNPTVGDAATAAAVAVPGLAVAGRAKGLTGLVGKDPITGLGAFTQGGKAVNQLAHGKIVGALGSIGKGGLQMVAPSMTAAIANQTIPLELPKQTEARLDADPTAAGLEQDPRSGLGSNFVSRMALPFVAAGRSVTGQPGGVGDTLRHSFGGLNKLTDTAVNNPDVFNHRVGRFFKDIGHDVRYQFDRTNPNLPINQLKSLTSQEQTAGREAARKYEAAMAAGDQATAERIQSEWQNTARQLRAKYEGIDTNAPGAIANTGPAGQRVASGEILSRLRAHYGDDPAAEKLIQNEVSPQLDNQGLSLRPAKDYESPNFSSSFVTGRDLANSAAAHGINGYVPLLNNRRLPDVEGRLDAATKAHIEGVDRLKNQTGAEQVGLQTPMPIAAPPGSVAPPAPQPAVPPQLPPAGQPQAPAPRPAPQLPQVGAAPAPRPVSAPAPAAQPAAPAPSTAQPGANPWSSREQAPAPAQIPTGTQPQPAAAQLGIPGVTPEVGQKLQQMISGVAGPAAGTAAGMGAAGMAGLAGKIESTPPPPGAEGYWGSLGWESKALIIAGLSVTALSALKSMTGDKEEGDGSFLSRVMPLLGLGAAAWGAGGGNFGGNFDGPSGKMQLPTGQKYRDGANSITDGLGLGRHL